MSPLFHEPLINKLMGTMSTYLVRTVLREGGMQKNDWGRFNRQVLRLLTYPSFYMHAMWHARLVEG